jgi:hypothetical protein
LAGDSRPLAQETLPERTLKALALGAPVAGLLAASTYRGLEAGQTVSAAKPGPRAMLG